MPVTDVHVIGDNAPLYTALGAIAGVIVGSGASWIQQRSKITEDREQLKQRLDAERQRLEARLKYDRDAQELDALRRVIDDGSVLLEENRRTLRLRAKAGLGEGSDAEKEHLKAKHKEDIKEGQAIDSRIKLWLPDEDPIYEAFRSVIEELNGGLDLFYEGSYQEVLNLDDDLAMKIEHFQDVARDRVGLRSLIPPAVGA